MFVLWHFGMRTVCLSKELINMLHTFLESESSVTIMLRDVGTIKQVLNWTNRLPFLELFPQLSLFWSVIAPSRSSLRICS